MPLFSPRWNALAREAGIASHAITFGLEALRQAHYADKGLYNRGFFGLSIGLKRMLKLLLLIEYAIQNKGRFPSNDYLKQYGHDLQKLLAEARNIFDRYGEHEYSLPVGGIEDDIVRLLDRFARVTRYYNLDFLAGRSQPADSMDPIAEWYTKIGSQILAKHYSSKNQNQDRARAAVMQGLMGPVSMVRFLGEDDQQINSIEDASLRSAENKVIQKFGTFYCAKIARFLYVLLRRLEFEAHRAKLDDVPALHEFFFPFLNSDSYLKSRKTFPARG